MKVAIACGGTGGHIFPGLATGRALKARGHVVSLWLAGKDVESEAVKGWDGPIVTIPSQGFPRRPSLEMFRALVRLVRAQQTGYRLMAQEAPDVVLAMGSYASVGPVIAARRLGIPYVLHEANVIPGRAISWLAPAAHSVGVSFEATRFYLRRARLTETGMPLRRELVDAASADAGVERGAEPFTVLVMGGSRGAHALNRLVTESLCMARRQGAVFRVIHLAGLHEAVDVRAGYATAGVEARVETFVHDMASIYRSADLAICRSGAASCAELCMFGVPSLLVPLPTAIRDHQTANAQSLERAGAAQVVAERHLRADWLAGYIADAVAHPARLRTMGQAARRQGKVHAAEALARLVEAAAESRRVT